MRPASRWPTLPASNVAWGSDTDAAETAVAPYFWLSVSNVIRMGDLIARDLEALFPDSAAAIAANLEALKRSLLELRGDYQDRLIETGADVVFALTGDFVYLTNDMGSARRRLFHQAGCPLDGRRPRDADAALARPRHQRRAAQVAAERGHSERRARRWRELVVLDAGDPGVVVERALAADGLQQILRKNLDAIVAAAAGQ